MLLKIIYKLKRKDIKLYKDNVAKLRNIMCSIQGDYAELIQKDKNDEVIAASKGLLKQGDYERLGESDKELLNEVVSSLNLINKIEKGLFFKIIKKELDK